MVDEDARLMLAFKNGDRKAFDALFERYTPRLLGFLFRMVRDQGKAEELTQDVFIRLYDAAGRYEPRARFSTYVFGIARNLAPMRMPDSRPCGPTTPWSEPSTSCRSASGQRCCFERRRGWATKTSRRAWRRACPA
jgi:RNA polymerase sigma-70 factor (ECF subfamily)